MKVLSAIGRFFARIGRWIKETAWIQPLLIVGAIFAIIFAIPHIINGVKGWFSSSDSTNAFFAQYRLSLNNADNIKDGASVGSSDVDKFLTYVEDGERDQVTKMVGAERFFVAFIQKESGSSKELYEGIKEFRDNFNRNDEFLGLKGKFKLITIYIDTTNDDDENLFDMVWINHYSLFETMSDGNYLPLTPYATNNDIGADKYEKNFSASESEEKCPMDTPLMMYFDYTADNWFDEADQKVLGLSDVLFSVDGNSKLEKAYLLRDCWSHADKFADYKH